MGSRAQLKHLLTEFRSCRERTGDRELRLLSASWHEQDVGRDSPGLGTSGCIFSASPSNCQPKVLLYPAMQGRRMEEGSLLPSALPAPNGLQRILLPAACTAKC